MIYETLKNEDIAYAKRAGPGPVFLNFNGPGRASENNYRNGPGRAEPASGPGRKFRPVLCSTKQWQAG